MNLFGVKSKFRILIDMLEDPEVSDEAWCDTFDAIEDELEDKMVAYAAVCRSMDADVDALTKEIDRLQAMRASYKKRIEYLKSSALDAMKLAGVTKIDRDPRFKISIRKNGGKLPLILRDDVPDQFAKFEKKPDNEKIRKALDSGEVLPFAEYGERGESWRY